MALLGMFNVHRHGAINSAAIVLYALTSCVSGYVSCCFYTQINGQRWVWNIILTSSLFSGEHLDINIFMLRQALANSVIKAQIQAGFYVHQAENAFTQGSGTPGESMEDQKPSLDLAHEAWIFPAL